MEGEKMNTFALSQFDDLYKLDKGVSFQKGLTLETSAFESHIITGNPVDKTKLSCQFKLETS